MAKKRTTKRAKAEKLPPVGTRWGYIPNMGKCWWEVRPEGLMFLNMTGRWIPSGLIVKELDRDHGPRIPPKNKPARDSAAMRRKAVAGVLGGWVVGEKRAEAFVEKHYDGRLECSVTVMIPASSYAAFLADPSVNGAAS